MKNKNTKIKRFYTLAYRMDGYCSTIEESDDLDELLCKKKWYLEMVTRKYSAINRIVTLNRENIVYWDSDETGISQYVYYNNAWWYVASGVLDFSR